MLVNTIVGDGETFYYHVAKNHVPRATRPSFKILGCSVSTWKMQGFEHRNEQSKHACDHKTSGKSNCCKKFLKGLHNKFLNN